MKKKNLRLYVSLGTRIGEGIPIRPQAQYATLASVGSGKDILLHSL